MEEKFHWRKQEIPCKIDGIGRDFDPLLTEVFLSLRDQVTEAHRSAAPSVPPASLGQESVL